MLYDPNELLPVVNQHDKQIALEYRARIHELQLKHRTVQVLLFNYHAEVYLHQRSKFKDVHPELWTTSATGHVEPGETYAMAANRELGEELGISQPCCFLGKIPPQPLSGNAFIGVYAARSNKPPWPDAREIKHGNFFNFRQAWQLALNKNIAVPSLKLALVLAAKRGWIESNYE